MQKSGKFAHVIRLKDLGFLLSCVAFIGFCAFVLVPDRNGEIKILSFSIIFLALYPIWRYNRKPDKASLYISVISILYGFYFAISLLMPFEFYLPFRSVPEESRVEALRLTLMGLSLMLFAFYSCSRRAVFSWCPRFPSVDLDKPYTNKTATYMGIVGIGSIVLSVVGPVPSSLGQFLTLFSQLSLLSTAILYYNQLNGRLSGHYKIFLWGVLIPIQFLIDISTGLLFSLIRDASVILMTYMLFKKRIPWGSLGMSAAILFLLLMSKGQFREATWNPQNNESDSIFSKIVIYSNLISQSTSSYDPEVTTKTFEGITNRLDFHSILADVIYKTPKDVPYWEGETYIPLLTRFIPRAIWPDKPEETTGQDFGHRYSILDENDFNTSLNTPQIVELYANFGIIGVVLGMTLIGAIYKMIYLFLEHEGSNQWNHFVAIVIYSSLINIDSNFSLSFGNVIPSLIFYYFLGRMVFPTPRSRPARRGVAVAIASS